VVGCAHCDHMTSRTPGTSESIEVRSSTNLSALDVLGVVAPRRSVSASNEARGDPPTVMGIRLLASSPALLSRFSHEPPGSNGPTADACNS